MRSPSGEICLVVGFSGDVKQAQKRAAEAKAASRSLIRSRMRARSSGSTISLSRRRQQRRRGACADRLPAAPGRRGEELQRDLVRERQPRRARALIDKAIIEDKTVYPDDATMKTFYTITVARPENAAADEPAVDQDQDGAVSLSPFRGARDKRERDLRVLSLSP